MAIADRRRLPPSARSGRSGKGRVTGRPAWLRTARTSLARPEHEGGAAIGALERRPLVAGRLLEFCSSGSMSSKASGGESSSSSTGCSPSAERCHRAAASRTGNTCRPLTSPASKSSSLGPAAAARAAIVGVFGGAALLDRHQRQVQLAAGLPRGRSEHTGHRGVGAFQSVETEFGRRVGVIERIDQLFGRIIARRCLPVAHPATTPQRRPARFVARRLGHAAPCPCARGCRPGPSGNP